MTSDDSAPPGLAPQSNESSVRWAGPRRASIAERHRSKTNCCESRGNAAETLQSPDIIGGALEGSGASAFLEVATPTFCICMS